MPFLERENAKIYYEDNGAGDSIIAIHGLAENTSYWNLSGLSKKFAEQYRFIPMDMRGHGQTKSDPNNSGFDVETIIDDIQCLADSLEIERFHLLGHSTGGMVSVRYAIQNCKNLKSLILTDSSSATSLHPGDETERKEFMEKFATGFANLSWEQMINFSKMKPFPFFLGYERREDQDALWEMTRKTFEQGDNKLIASFVRSFYTDPDPMVEGLRSITVPTLILLGDLDTLFIKPGELMAKEIPDTRYVLLGDVGHMTAFEAPDRLYNEICSFIQDS